MGPRSVRAGRRPMLPQLSHHPRRIASGLAAVIRYSAMIACFGVMFCTTFGCSHEGIVRVDLQPDPVRFIIDHAGWPRPFWSPRVTEFAIASEEDGPIWQLQSIDEFGLAARNLIFDYGRVPAGFVQIFPEDGRRPTSLRTHRTYFVAAGGPNAVYRIVFAMPVSGWTPVLPVVPRNPREFLPANPTTTQPTTP